VKLIAFAISGCVTGLAGGLYAIFLGSVPETAMQIETSVIIVLLTVIGGTRSLYGSFLGATLYFVLSDYVSQTWERWQFVIALALVMVVLYLNDGLLGLSKAVGRSVMAPLRNRTWRGSSATGRAS
jgi:branched-chain amino acid transport system permease protein